MSGKKDPQGSAEATATEKAQKAAGDPEVCRRYDFAVIRALRQQRALSIERFAQLCGLSPAPISRIETNLIKPNLDTLDRIADGLGMSTHSLLAMAERREVMRQRHREFREGGFSFRAISTAFGELIVGEARKGGQAASPLFHSRGYVNLLVISGALEVKIGDRVTRIPAGEGAELVSLTPVHYHAPEDCTFSFVVGKPPRPEVPSAVPKAP